MFSKAASFFSPLRTRTVGGATFPVGPMYSNRRSTRRLAAAGGSTGGSTFGRAFSYRSALTTVTFHVLLCAVRPAVGAGSLVSCRPNDAHARAKSSAAVEVFFIRSPRARDHTTDRAAVARESPEKPGHCDTPCGGATRKRRGDCFLFDPATRRPHEETSNPDDHGSRARRRRRGERDGPRTPRRLLEHGAGGPDFRLRREAAILLLRAARNVLRRRDRGYRAGVRRLRDQGLSARGGHRPPVPEEFDVPALRRRRRRLLP